MSRHVRRAQPFVKRPSRTAAALALIGVLGGCSVLPQRSPPPTVTAYRITTPELPRHPIVEKPACPTLRLEDMETAAGFSGSAMRYSETPGTLDHFAFHRWVAPPNRMLDPLLLQTITASGLFDGVITASSPANATLQLDTRLIALTQRFRKTGSSVHLVIRASLSDLATHRQIAARRFVIDEPADAATPEAGVRATDRAVTRLTRELTLWLRKLSTHSSPCSG